MEITYFHKQKRKRVKWFPKIFDVSQSLFTIVWQGTVENSSARPKDEIRPLHYIILLSKGLQFDRNVRSLFKISKF